MPFNIHLYVAPFGVVDKTVLAPAQNESVPVILTTGFAFTVAVTESLVVAKHPVVVFLACAK